MINDIKTKLYEICPGIVVHDMQINLDSLTHNTKISLTFSQWLWEVDRVTVECMISKTTADKAVEISQLIETYAYALLIEVEKFNSNKII